MKIENFNKMEKGATLLMEKSQELCFFIEKAENGNVFVLLNGRREEYAPEDLGAWS